MTAHKHNENIHILYPHTSKTLRSVTDLQEAGFVPENRVQALQQVADRYTVAVTPAMAELIENHREGMIDPIAAQFIPTEAEMVTLPQEISDPIGDYHHSPLKALVHRHGNRVLLKPTLACAVYCRFCFRREMVGPNGDSISQKDVDDALAYIAENKQIHEVILTGGDPLVLSAARLQSLMQRLHAMPHLRYIRLHTRIPIVQPGKISREVAEGLRGPKPVYMAVHANHAREFTPQAAQALARLADGGIVLLGQSVLLKNINNTLEALADLCETMLQHRVKPYYLHHPDLAIGTSHFRLSLEEGMALMDGLRQRVSGIAVPQYTLDIPAGDGMKIAISRETVRRAPSEGTGVYILRDPTGREYRYSDPLMS